MVCYGGPVKAANTGPKPGGTLLNGWAVRKPVLWWRPRLHVDSDGIMSVPINTTANGRRLCQRSPWEGGKSVERARSPRMLGEYGLYLVLKDGHFHAFQVLIKVFFFFFLEKPTRTIALSKKYPRSPCVSFHFNSLHIILPSLPCLFQAVPLGVREVTGDSWGRKRM